jgi:hypothetical protein
MIIALALKNQWVSYWKFEIYTSQILKPYDNGFPVWRRTTGRQVGMTLMMSFRQG